MRREFLGALGGAAARVRRFVEGADRSQSTLFPQYLEDWIGEDNPVRVIDVFVEDRRINAVDFGAPKVAWKLYQKGWRVGVPRRKRQGAGGLRTCSVQIGPLTAWRPFGRLGRRKLSW